jgi:hypothetical protein
MDTDLEQQLRLVEQELSQVQGFFFSFGFILELFFFPERIDKHLPCCISTLAAPCCCWEEIRLLRCS